MASIPKVAEPRGHLGIVEDTTTMCWGWCRPMGKHVIRQTDGQVNRDLSWHGASTSTSLGSGTPKKEVVDLSDAVSPGSHKLLKEKIQAGYYPSALPETHRGVIPSVGVPEVVRQSLGALHQDVHNAYDKGSGDYNVDEYSILLPSLPEKYPTPEEFLLGYLRSPNRMAHETGVSGGFEQLSKFQLKEAGTKKEKVETTAIALGDWYHIKIPGNNGDVMIVDIDMASTGAKQQRRRWSATVQTMTDHELLGLADDHPVSGRRQFGLEMLEEDPEGGTPFRFYTRGFDRQTSLAMDVQFSNVAQHRTFSALMKAMAKEHSGRPERVDELGHPRWGWVRQIPIEVLLSSMEPPA